MTVRLVDYLVCRLCVFVHFAYSFILFSPSFVDLCILISLSDIKMRVILSTLSLLSIILSLVSAEDIVTVTDEITISTVTSTVSVANGTASGQTSVPLLNLLRGSSNATYTPHTYLGQVVAISAGNTVYAISCLVASGNSTSCGAVPITVTQGPSSFVRVDAMAATATPSFSFNASGIARPTGAAPATALVRAQSDDDTRSSLSCSLSPDSAVCVNIMVVPPIPSTVSALAALPSADLGNRTIAVTSTFAKADIAWDVLVITQGIELVNAAVIANSGANGSNIVEYAAKTPVGPSKLNNLLKNPNNSIC
jgi:hypothetical protein